MPDVLYTELSAAIRGLERLTAQRYQRAFVPSEIADADCFGSLHRFSDNSFGGQQK
jgi:hypothetical protein